MVDQQIGMDLHQKHFRGEILTSKEEKQLVAWYAQEDEAETIILNANTSEKKAIEQLREQVAEILNQLTQITRSIQLIANENNDIRQENARLFQLLSKKSDSKAA